MLFFYCIVLLLLLGIACPAVSQNSENCEQKKDYLDTCTSLKADAKCSRQLTELCCNCQERWKISIPYCSFSSVVFALPTPYFTPTPGLPGNVPTPADDGLNGGFLSQYTCSAGVSSFLLEGKPKPVAGQTYEWVISCRDTLGQENIEKLPGSLLKSSEAGKNLTVSFLSPASSVEIVCLAEFKVFQNNILTQSYKNNILVTSCELGCIMTDHQSILVAMDGVAASQKRIGTTAVNLMMNARVYSKSKAAKLHKELHANYLEVWGSTWRIPIVSASCSNLQLCKNQSLGELYSVYDQKVDVANKLLKKILKTKRNLSEKHLKKLKRLKLQADTAWRIARSKSALLPENTSACEAPMDARFLPATVN